SHFVRETPGDQPFEFRPGPSSKVSTTKWPRILNQNVATRFPVPKKINSARSANRIDATFVSLVMYQIFRNGRLEHFIAFRRVRVARPLRRYSGCVQVPTFSSPLYMNG